MEKNMEAMAAQRMRREASEWTTALLQVVGLAQLSVISITAAEINFTALPRKFEELKVSFALEKIPHNETGRQ
jgi:hypothetical protein